MASLFTKIYRGELPGFVIAETEQAFAILNRYPVKRGHVLILPKEEIPHLFDLDSETYQAVWQFTRKVALALQTMTKAEKIGMVLEGYGIKDHAHIHLMPLSGPGQLNINQAPEASDNELAEVAKEFQSVWNTLL
jgi:histidine triad (HIT) family protein